MTSITRDPDLTKAKLPIPAVWHLLTVVIAVLLAYAAVTNRVSIVETKQAESKDRLERLESKIDRILERVTK